MPGGMGDGSVKPPNPNTPPANQFIKLEDQFAKFEVTPGLLGDAANQFDKDEPAPGSIQDAANQFDKDEPAPGSIQDAANQFDKDEPGPGSNQNAANQFVKGEDQFDKFKADSGPEQ
ncbi:MAG: hypothetical protein ABSB41_19150 [Anaerolineales bacterium]